MDAVPVHTVLPLLGVCGAVVIAAFSVAMVYASTVGEGGGMHFISDGINMHCGWSAVVMATAGAAVGVCELVPALHARRWGCVRCVGSQLLSWNLILGVAETGWPLHYVSEGIFFAAALWYHTMMSRDATYGHPAYVWSQGAFALSTLLLVVAYVGSLGGEGAYAPKDIAVCCELLLVACMTACILSLMHSLNRFACIHIRFDTYH